MALLDFKGRRREGARRVIPPEGLALQKEQAYALLRAEAPVAPRLVEHLDLERHRRLRRVPWRRDHEFRIARVGRLVTARGIDQDPATRSVHRAY